MHLVLNKRKKVCWEVTAALEKIGTQGSRNLGKTKTCDIKDGTVGLKVCSIYLPTYLCMEFVTVLVRDPRIQKEDSWHSYIDYEIFIHTNSICFTRKTSCVRRRYREFVWLRQRLQSNAVLIQLPELPSKTPFFNMNNPNHVDHRRQGLQEFLEKILQDALLLSDSRLHLFLQTQLSPEDMEACVSGQTKFSVADAILSFASLNRRFPIEDEEEKKGKNDADSDSESSSSGLGPSDDSISCGCKASPASEES
ncbi:sorting nexin-10 isoform X1 [Pyrgilauda ruficollis]|uniref:sorting nexin-10 isoform X1 n=3 Tax=Passeriformes TaxID=9126 RepID=UPI001B885B16|nr:sorting nexin-10 isoform X1 [Pyrgilauda ruficollis]